MALFSLKAVLNCGISFKCASWARHEYCSSLSARVNVRFRVHQGRRCLRSACPHQKSIKGSTSLFGVPFSHSRAGGSCNSCGRRVSSSFCFVRSRYLVETFSCQPCAVQPGNLRSYSHESCRASPLPRSIRTQRWSPLFSS